MATQRPRGKSRVSRAPRTPEAEWLSPAEAAHHLGVSPSTLARKRIEGNGPPFKRPTPRLVRYSRAELDSWLGESRDSTSSTLPPAA